MSRVPPRRSSRAAREPLTSTACTGNRVAPATRADNASTSVQACPPGPNARAAAHGVRAQHVETAHAGLACVVGHFLVALRAVQAELLHLAHDHPRLPAPAPPARRWPHGKTRGWRCSCRRSIARRRNPRPVAAGRRLQAGNPTAPAPPAGTARPAPPPSPPSKPRCARCVCLRANVHSTSMFSPLWRNSSRDGGARMRVDVRLPRSGPPRTSAPRAGRRRSATGMRTRPRR